MNNCLYCYKNLLENDIHTPAGKSGYHNSCSKKLFGKVIPPVLFYTQDEILQLAEKVIRSQRTVTGVQAKLSLGLEKMGTNFVPDKLTIIGLWGEYILKPQTKLYRNLPEIEDLTMHLAELSNIKTVQHSLIYLKSGELAYITKRIDRFNNKKLHMEDMCQLSERLTEHKYLGSYEQIAKIILRNSQNPGFDVMSFYEQVIFSFLTGNSDMHLKNFSLLKTDSLNYSLCPAYDLVASELLIEDKEELALTLNGKKKKIKYTDFYIAMKSSKIEEKTIENIFNNFSKIIPSWYGFINNSFLSDEFKIKYCSMVEIRAKRIFG